MRAVSLLFHDVVPDGSYDQSGFPGAAAAVYKMSEDEFSADVHAIQARGAVIVTTNDLSSGNSLERPVMLTFDDGGVGAYDSVAGILKELDYKGHFFVTTDYIGSPTFLSAKQIAELSRMGHVIGTHSCSHPGRMSCCKPDELAREWERSVEVLSDILGSPVKTASVPGGYYSRKVAEAADGAGIRFLFTSEPTSTLWKVGDCAVLGRFTIKRGVHPEDVAALASGELVPSLRQWTAWNTKKIMKRLGGKSYLRLRKYFLSR